jgi:hypothetical protein
MLMLVSDDVVTFRSGKELRKTVMLMTVPTAFAVLITVVGPAPWEVVLFFWAGTALFVSMGAW